MPGLLGVAALYVAQHGEAVGAECFDCCDGFLLVERAEGDEPCVVEAMAPDGEEPLLGSVVPAYRGGVGLCLSVPCPLLLGFVCVWFIFLFVWFI